MPIQEVPYIVNILVNGITNCGGSILTSELVLTAAHCVNIKNVTIKILSGSEYADRGIEHNLTGKLIHPHYRKSISGNDIALLKISPPIDLIHSHNRKIELYKGNVPLRTFGTISGWGCIGETG